jgi:hypothetical protein
LITMMPLLFFITFLWPRLELYFLNTNTITLHSFSPIALLSTPLYPLFFLSHTYFLTYFLNITFKIWKLESCNYDMAIQLINQMR